MKSVLFLTLIALSAPSFASLECTAVVRDIARSSMKSVELVKVTTLKKREDYLGKVSGFWFMASHNLANDALYMDIVTPEGALATSTTVKASELDSHLVWSEGHFEIDLSCNKITE